MGGKVYGGPKWTVSPVYEGMLKEELDAAAERNPDVPTSRCSSTRRTPAWSAGAVEEPLVIPALNRDGDCLSDLVMPMFGSIAGAESVLLAFDDDFSTKVAMAEAPARHGAGAPGQGRRQPDGDAAGLRRGPALRGREGLRGRRAASRAIYESVLEATPPASGHRISAVTPRTTEFTDEVVAERAQQDRRLVVARGSGSSLQDRLQIRASVRAAS